MSLLAPNATQAQIIPDNSLPDNSVVRPQGDVINIDGGTTAGNNLFHSFEQFSVPTNNTAFFNNALDIQNIFSRVTGSSISEIEGKLKANGATNLFLINPNGIIFGQKASLELGGSFFASTASSINFADGSQFSAIAPQSSPLLTVSAPIGLGLGAMPANITNQLSDKQLKLEVPNGQTLALIGGEVNLNRARLKAPEGLIEIGGLAAAGNIQFNDNGSLSFPEGIARANVSLDNKTEIQVEGGSGGTINFNVANLEIVDKNSSITAGIKKNQGSDFSQAGDININATGDVMVAGEISNELGNGSSGHGGDINLNATGDVIVAGEISNDAKGQGNAGNIFVTARNLTLVEKGQIRSNAKNTGDAGDIIIQVNEAVELIEKGKIQSEVDDDNASGNGGDIFINAIGDMTVEGEIINDTSGKGNAGNLFITAKNLTVAEGGTIRIKTTAAGDVGDIMIQVNEAVRLIGNSDIRNEVSDEASGNGGDIKISSNSLLIESLSEQEQAQIRTLTGGYGDGGIIYIHAGELSIIGPGVSGSSGITASTAAAGDGGGINIILDGALTMINRGKIQSNVTRRQSNTTGSGNAGDINIIAESLSLRENSFITALTRSRGNAGKISISTTGAIEIIGDIEESRSSISTEVDDFPNTGEGGDINIHTQSLFVLNGGSLRASTEGDGNAGNIEIIATDIVEFSGIDGFRRSSGLFSSTFERAQGSGGNIKVTTPTLRLSNRGVINAENNSKNPDTRGGDILINVELLEVLGEAEIISSASAKGVAGTLNIEADSIHLDNGSLEAETRAGKDGNIELKAQDIILRHGSDITTNATEDATGGNITINTDILAALEDSDITARAVEGSGGNIQIATQGIFLSPDSEINASSQLGIDGIVTINTPEVDPTSGILELPSTPIDAESIVAKNPCAIEEGKIAGGSSFVITGRGGLPPSSDDPLPHTSRVVEWASRSSQQGNSPVVLRQRVQTNQQGERTYPVIEQAQGWMVAPDGTILLTATPANVMPQSPGLTHPHCRTSSTLNKRVGSGE